MSQTPSSLSPKSVGTVLKEVKFNSPDKRHSSTGTYEQRAITKERFVIISLHRDAVIDEHGKTRCLL